MKKFMIMLLILVFGNYANHLLGCVPIDIFFTATTTGFFFFIFFMELKGNSGQLEIILYKARAFSAFVCGYSRIDE